MAKRTKEERQSEFVKQTERMLGFPLISWQKDWIENALSLFAAGRPVDICICPPDESKIDRHRIGCPKR
jgi:hypothetical protein